jgi:hypothetical protein
MKKTTTRKPRIATPEQDGAIFSIGYGGRTDGLENPQQLHRMVLQLDATLVDCRSKPTSRKAGFGGQQLALLFNGRYEWHGAELGGMGEGVTARGIAWLRSQKAEGRRLVLMCMEAEPWLCHRHHRIAMRAPDLGVLHIYREPGTSLWDVFTAADVQTALLAGEEMVFPVATLHDYYVRKSA